MAEGSEKDTKETEDGQDILQSSGLGQLMSILKGHLDLMLSKDAHVDSVIESCQSKELLYQAKNKALENEKTLLLSIMNDIGEMSNFLNDIILIENLFNNKFSPLKQEQEAARNTYAKSILKYENKPKPRNDIASFVELVFGGQTHISSLQTWLDKLVGQCEKENINIIYNSKACCKKIERAFYKSFYVYIDDDGYNDTTDVMRCSLVFDNFDDIYKTFSIVELMADESLGGILRVKDRFHPENVPFGYRDLMINLYCPGAKIICELQLHHKLFFDMKKISHKMYKRARLFEREKQNLAYEYAQKYMRPKIGKLKVYQIKDGDKVGDDDDEKDGMDKFDVLLKQWGLQKYIKTFQEEGWDDTADWHELTDDDLKEMKIATGHLKKFKRKYKEWKATLEEVVKVEKEESKQEKKEDAEPTKEQSEVKKILTEWGLQKYTNAFVDEGYDDPSIWNEISEDDLKNDLKLSKGHIKKFLLKVKTLKGAAVEAKTEEKKEEKKESGQLIENGEYYLQCQYKSSFMFESELPTGYKDSGGASIHVGHNSKAKSKMLWRIDYVLAGKYFTIRNVDTGRYLYESAGSTGYTSNKGNKSMFVVSHPKGNTWSSKKARWLIEKSKKSGYFNLKSLWRGGYAYAADTSFKNKSVVGGVKNCHCAGSVEAVPWTNGKAYWKLIRAEKTDQVVPNGTYNIQCQYKNSFMFESESPTGYKDSGGASIHVGHNSKAKAKMSWRIEYLRAAKYYTIRNVDTGRYLYESAGSSGWTSGKGNTSMFVVCHPKGDTWSSKKARWLIEKSKKSGYFNLKSLWRGGFAYAADTSFKNKSMVSGVKNFHCAGNVEAVPWTNGKAHWKLIEVKKSDQIIPNGTYNIQCQYKNSFMFESDLPTGYKDSGGASIYVSHNSKASAKMLWRIEYVSAGKYFTIRCVDTGRYLYESAGSTGYTSSKGNTSMFVASHPKADAFGTKKGRWIITKSKKGGYFNLKSQWRGGYAYAADTPMKNKTSLYGVKNCHCAGNAEAAPWTNGKGNWKLTAVRS